MIKLVIVGRLGKDAESGTTPEGTAYTRFSVAANTPGKDSPAVWVSCTWYNPNPKVLPYLTKGKQVYLEGVPKFSVYEGAAQVGLAVKQLELLGDKTNADAF